MYHFITKCKPDIIIGTHPFCVNMISSLKKHKFIDIPFISIITDFKAHYAYMSSYVDAYITASEYTKENMDQHIVSQSKIFPYGIPIKEEFFLKDDEFLKNNRDDYFNILLMGGSMGVSGINDVLKELMHNTNKLRITVICGNNRELKEALEKDYDSYSSKKVSGDSNKKVHVFGFTKAIASLMELSDIVISKPGGLTTSEALVKRLPMIFPFAIPGQETENAEFLSSMGCAIYEPNLNKLNGIIDDIILNPKKLEDMKSNIERLSKYYSIEEIVSLSEELIKTYKNKTS